jgi:hemolysin activation/secretion protein
MPAGSRGALLALLLAAAPGGALAQASRLPGPPAPSAFELELEGKVHVREIRVEGARSLPPQAIRDIVAPYEGKALGVGDYREIARKLTQLYSDSGFVTSGVVLRGRPDDGVLVFEAAEGTLERVRFASPPKVARPEWLTGLLVPDPRAPVRLADLQERMAAVRDAGVVERIEARIEPLPRLGESELVLSIEEPRPWWAAVQYDNHHSPVVGARRPSLLFGHQNITGWGDSLDARVGRTEGLEDVRVAYAFPFLRSRWRAGARFERSDSLAIDPPSFRSLEIKSLSETRALDLQYSFLTRASRAVALGVAAEKRESETSLLGIPFSFIAGLPDAVVRLDVERAFFVFTQRAEGQVAYLRTQASFGRVKDVLTDVAGAPNPRFSAYLLQGQYARRLHESGLHAVARLEGQYTGDTLVPLEKYVLGGAQTLRGYRESVLLRDRALFGSLELRSPPWRFLENARLELAAFVDAAWARNTLRVAGDSSPERLASVGVGVALALPAGLSARVDYGYPTRRWLTERRDLQDRGLHFLVSWRFTDLLP